MCLSHLLDEQRTLAQVIESQRTVTQGDLRWVKKDLNLEINSRDNRSIGVGDSRIG
jgi:hypothetical protein